MFDIAPSEFLLTAIVAIVVIGPKDMPLALRTAGRWIGKMRRMSNHLRAGFDAIIREAEMEEMERKWREQNAAIMAAHPDAVGSEASATAGSPPVMMPLPAPPTSGATIEQPAIAQAGEERATGEPHWHVDTPAHPTDTPARLAGVSPP